MTAATPNVIGFEELRRADVALAADAGTQLPAVSAGRFQAVASAAAGGDLTGHESDPRRPRKARRWRRGSPVTADGCENRPGPLTGRAGDKSGPLRPWSALRQPGEPLDGL